MPKTKQPCSQRARNRLRTIVLLAESGSQLDSNPTPNRTDTECGPTRHKVSYGDAAAPARTAPPVNKSRVGLSRWQSRLTVRSWFAAQQGNSRLVHLVRPYRFSAGPMFAIPGRAEYSS